MPTDENLRVMGSSRVFAVGDCQTSADEKTAVNAGLTADLAARNAEVLLSDPKLLSSS